jgi:SAM-dependent methyltransferase
VLEIGDDSYTKQFGGGRVSQSDVLHVKEGAPGATIIGDLSNAPQIADDSFDCLILTQVLVVIFDLPATIATIHRILKPGGVVLITVPGISNIDKDEWRDQWMWSFTPNSLRRLLELRFRADKITVGSRGNVLTSIAFLQGLCAEDLKGFPAAADDPHYPQTVLGRAVK